MTGEGVTLTTEDQKLLERALMASTEKLYEFGTAPAEMPGVEEIQFVLAQPLKDDDWIVEKARAILDFFAPILAEKERLERDLSEARRHASLGCDAADGGPHTIIAQGSYHFCGACGETVKNPPLSERARKFEARALAAEAENREIKKQMLTDEGQHRDALAAERERFDAMVRAYEARALEEERSRLEAAAPLSARETARYLEIEQKLAALNAAAIRAEGE